MTQPFPPSDAARPLAPQARWWIVGSVAVLLGLWELVFHLWFMDLPMVAGHRLNALIAAALVAAVILAAFRLIGHYEEQLASAAAALRQTNEALQALEAERDTRLVDLARDLGFALADLSAHCDIGEGLPTPTVTNRAFEDIRTHARQLRPVVNSLLDLKHDHDRLTAGLPAVLADYEHYRERETGPATRPTGGDSHGTDTQAA